MRLIGDIMPKAKKKRRKKTNKAAKDTTNKKNFVMVHEEKSTFHDISYIFLKIFIYFQIRSKLINFCYGAN